MKIVIEAEPKEIAAFVLEVQEPPLVPQIGKSISKEEWEEKQKSR